MVGKYGASGRQSRGLDRGGHVSEIKDGGSYAGARYGPGQVLGTFLPGQVEMTMDRVRYLGAFLLRSGIWVHFYPKTRPAPTLSPDPSGATSPPTLSTETISHPTLPTLNYGRTQALSSHLHYR